MNDLLARAIAAHGGLDRWNTFKRVSATIIAGGGLLPMKGLELDALQEEQAVVVSHDWGAWIACRERIKLQE
jgi:hypothetical protein